MESSNSNYLDNLLDCFTIAVCQHAPARTNAGGGVAVNRGSIPSPLQKVIDEISAQLITSILAWAHIYEINCSSHLTAASNTLHYVESHVEHSNQNPLNETHEVLVLSCTSLSRSKIKQNHVLSPSEVSSGAHVLGLPGMQYTVAYYSHEKIHLWIKVMNSFYWMVLCQRFI